MIPLSLAPDKYLIMHSMASACSILESEFNLAHWCTAYATSGRVDFSRKFNVQISDQ